LRSDADDFATGAISIGDAKYYKYNNSRSDIPGLISGSSFGSLIEGSGSGHHVIGIRDNDVQDCFAVISGSGNYNTDSTYDKLVFQAKADGTLTANGGNTIWHGGNDGSGSGLDADTVDGIQASSFLRSDADDTTTGDLTVSGSLLPEFMRITGTSTNGYAQFSFGSSSSPSTTGTHMINTASGLFQIKTGNPLSGSATKQLEIDTSGNLTATGNITAYSDERLKSDVKTLDGSKVYQMRGVSFTKEGAAGSGVIAQELQKVAPELVQDGGEYLSVAYGNVVGYLIEAVKELKVELEDLKKG